MRSDFPVTGRDLAFLDTDPVITERWDREWLHYLATEDPAQHLRSAVDMRPATSLDDRRAAAVFDTKLVAGFSPLNIWVDGAQLVNKRVLEIGCGCGFLGKQLGHVAAAYVGLDHSQLALSIARLTSPRSCTYLHMSNADAIATFAGSMDTMVGRHFFIHQNWARCSVVLRLAALLLRPTGRVVADFYLPAPRKRQGIVHPARHGDDERHPSCAYLFSLDDIHALAELHGFRIASSHDHFGLQRRFVQLERVAAT